MKQVTFVDPTEDHLKYIADNMNPFDAQEVKAVDGSSPLEALHLSVSMADEAKVVLLDGEPQLCFGVGSVDELPFVGIPWMLSTGKLYEWGETFNQHAFAVVERWSDEYPVLTNMTDARHHKAHRWLLKLGFQIVECVPDFGPERRPFYRFIKACAVL